MQDSLIKFNKFLQENESKKCRAEKRAAEEAKQRKMKEVEIEKLKEQLLSMTDECAKLKEKVEKNIMFQRYLEHVQDMVPEDYPELRPRNRYKTLQDAMQI